MKIRVVDLKPGMILKGGRRVVQAHPAACGDGPGWWGVIIEGQPYCQHSPHTVFDVLGPIYR